MELRWWVAVIMILAALVLLGVRCNPRIAPVKAPNDYSACGGNGICET